MTRPFGLATGLFLAVAAMSSEPARAADMATAAPVVLPQTAVAPRVDSFRDRFEFRFGVGMHGVGSAESGVVAVNPELVFPEFRLTDWPIDPRWAFIVPRLHIGGVANFAGRTSYFYVGGLWTYEITQKLFVEGFLGGAIHNGSLSGDPANHKSALGCRALFHTGGSIGYRLAPQWALMFTFDHVSNGETALGACGVNQGLNEYLLRVGYTF